MLTLLISWNDPNYVFVVVVLGKVKKAGMKGGEGVERKARPNMCGRLCWFGPNNVVTVGWSVLSRG